MSEIIDGMDQLDIFDWLGDETENVTIKPFDMLESENYLPSLIQAKKSFLLNTYKLSDKE